MRANVLRKYGKNLENIQFEERSSGSLASGEVRVAVHAAGLNPVDVKTIHGEPKMLLPFKPPFVLGVDMVGTVRQVGAHVQSVKVGDRVLAYSGMSQMGMFAEEVVLEEGKLAKAPARMSDEECACLPLPGLCALEALDALPVAKGHRVLIHGAAGAVGSMALAIAHARGAEVWVTASKADTEWLSALGAKRVIDYRSERFEDVTSGMDFVLDTVGSEVLMRSFSVLKPRGVLASLHVPPSAEVIQQSGLRANWLLRWLLPMVTSRVYKRAKAANVRLLPVMTVPNQRRLQEVVRLAELDGIAPRVDKVFDLSELPQAVSYFLTGNARGRVIFKNMRLHA